MNTTDLRKRIQLERAVRKWFPGGQRRGLLPGPFDKAVRLAKRRLGIGKSRLPTGHRPYVAAVLDAIESKSSLPVPPEEARQSLELCVAIYTAAITGQPVDLPLGEDDRFYHGISTEDYPNRERRPAMQEVQR